MKILFIGDIVGKVGRHMLRDNLARYKDKYHIDFVIANSENASAGFGVTLKNAKELLSYGVDSLTGGNHSFDKLDVYEEDIPIIRPINYYDDQPGVGYKIFDVGEYKLAVINALGAFTFTNIRPPFRMLIELVDELISRGINHIFLDFHAEATAEKEVIKHILSNKVSLIVGTHTHIGTDDLQIYNKTGYLTDIGMTGSFHGVIGMKKEEPIERMLNSISKGFKVDSGDGVLQFVVAELSDDGVCLDLFKIKYINGKEFILYSFK